MSHSVFRDLDSDKTSGNSSRSDIADNNLIIFINKDGDVQVDPDALQELVGECTNAFPFNRILTNSIKMLQYFFDFFIFGSEYK